MNSTWPIDLWVQHLIGLIAFALVLFLVALSNLRGLKRVESYSSSVRFPRVSILVPARNEANRIEGCIRSLLAQDYPHFAVLVLDDDSTDATRETLSELAARDRRLRVLQGTALPPGWIGKNWACEQLAHAADGELLLFTDADTRHHPSALADAVAALEAERADLVTGLPREVVVSWGEKLIVPFMSWIIFALVPLGWAHRLQWAPLSATIGQFMLFRRTAYEAIGRHASVRQTSVDDLALGRRLISRGKQWRLVDAGGRVQCRMYTNGSEAVEGFGRHLFAVFGYRSWLALPAWLWIGLASLEPHILLALTWAGVPFPALAQELALLAIVFSFMTWVIFCRRLKFPMYLALLYPISVLVVVSIALRSVWIHSHGRATWKGRVLLASDEIT